MGQGTVYYVPETELKQLRRRKFWALAAFTAGTVVLAAAAFFVIRQMLGENSLPAGFTVAFIGVGVGLHILSKWLVHQNAKLVCRIRERGVMAVTGAHGIWKNLTSNLRTPR